MISGLKDVNTLMILFVQFKHNFKNEIHHKTQSCNLYSGHADNIDHEIYFFENDSRW